MYLLKYSSVKTVLPGHDAERFFRHGTDLNGNPDTGFRIPFHGRVRSFLPGSSWKTGTL